LDQVDSAQIYVYMAAAAVLSKCVSKSDLHYIVSADTYGGTLSL